MKFPESVAIDCSELTLFCLTKTTSLSATPFPTVTAEPKTSAGRFSNIISEKELFKLPGIASAAVNTIYQLYALKKESPEYFEKAKTYLMLPEYFNFRLTGVKMNEFTNAFHNAACKRKKRVSMTRK